MQSTIPFIAHLNSSGRAGCLRSLGRTFGQQRTGQGGLVPLALSAAVREYLPFLERDADQAQPRRKRMSAPADNNTFVKPIKQCFVRNPRVMPMTRIMLTLLSGWAGQGGSIETTIGIVAAKLGRSRRQVFRYLQDALEEGYLSYSRTADRIGRYTGIRIRLNFAAIRFTHFLKPKNKSKTAETLDVPYMADTNNKFINLKETDADLWETLGRFASSAGYEMPDATLP